MAGQPHTRLRTELARLLSAQTFDSDRRLARSALMWLSVASRPLRAHELWVMLQIEQSLDTEHIERLLSEPGHVNGGEATATIRRLLGGLVSVRKDGIVALSHPELRTVLSQAEAGDDVLTSLAFTTRQAHVVAASVCMVICSVSTLRLALVHDDRVASGVVLYAWTSWSAHLALSGYALSNSSAANLFDSMALRVCTDVLVFLLTLSDVVTGPITVPATEDRLRCVALVLRAQQALEEPMALLSALVRLGEYTRALHGAREVVDGSRKLDGARSSRPSRQSVTGSALQDLPGQLPRMDGPVSRIETLRMDSLLAKTHRSLGKNERRVVLGFAGVARGLRAVAVALAEAPLHAELLEQYDTPWSPTDVLVHTANWMEGVASYPFWLELSTASTPSDVFNIHNTADEHFNAASLIRSRARHPEQPSGTVNPPVKPPSQPTTPDSVSNLTSMRFQAAKLLERLQTLQCPPKPGATYTINDLRFLSQRTSSFARVPSHIHGTEDPFAYISPFIPITLKRLYRRRIAPLRPALLKPLDDFGSAAFTGGVTTLWTQAKSSILADGHRSTTLYFLAAILLHHIRRTLTPWLAAYTYHTPIEDLRLVLSRPDVFLDDTLSLPWPWLLFTAAQKPLCDAAASAAISLLALDGRRRTHPPGMQRALDVARTAYLVWSLAAAEYMVDRTASTVAHAIAYAALLGGGADGRTVLARVLRRNPGKALFGAWRLYAYTRHGLCPLMAGAAGAAAQGQPGLLLVLVAGVGAVWAVLRFRSRLFIAIELGGLCVVVGLVLVVGVLLAWEFVEDPLGLKSGTARARRVGVRARRALPRGAAARAGILRRGTALSMGGDGLVRREDGEIGRERGGREKVE